MLTSQNGCMVITMVYCLVVSVARPIYHGLFKSLFTFVQEQNPKIHRLKATVTKLCKAKHTTATLYTDFESKQPCSADN